MVPAPKVVEYKCAISLGEGAYVNLGDFAKTCVSDPDVCASESATWSLWLKINSSAIHGDERYYFTAGGHSQQGRGVTLLKKVDSFDFCVRTKKQVPQCVEFENSKIPMDRWFHFAVTFDLMQSSAWLIVYLNGQELRIDVDHSATSSLPMKDGCTKLLLGNSYACNGPPLSSLRYGVTAAYSNLMVLDRLLSKKEMRNLYACGSLDWELKIRSLYIDDTNTNSGRLRCVCTASASTGPTIQWSVYYTERAEFHELGNSTEGIFEITQTAFSSCVLQSSLVIDQTQKPIGWNDVIGCKATTGSMQVSQYIHRGMVMTVSGLTYFDDFPTNGEERKATNGSYPFVCETASHLV
ncbi:uncharacterized protein LOC110987697 [Acanthaster planci]|uniref:Uncharacterized protein LOC110987697 n=1 Tax=Acanthaster planci TaxID=133434 RepID=A0A8B7ZL68_ACAPL|nr:uncharacterized protein LOC110987697 [Acanthaster planci]